MDRFEPHPIKHLLLLIVPPSPLPPPLLMGFIYPCTCPPAPASATLPLGSFTASELPHPTPLFPSLPQSSTDPELVGESQEGRGEKSGGCSTDGMATHSGGVSSRSRRFSAEERGEKREREDRAANATTSSPALTHLSLSFSICDIATVRHSDGDHEEERASSESNRP